MKLVVLVNPRARGTRRDPGLPARLGRIVAGAGEVLVPEAEALPQLAAQLAARPAPLVAICGGDGTGQTVLTELCLAYRRAGHRPPRVALLRGGTVNTVSHNLGVRGSPERLLARLCARLRDAAPLPVVSQQLLSVNGRFGFLFAAALGARFLELYYDHPEPGPARAARLAVHAAGSALFRGGLAERLFRPAGLGLSVDDEPPLRLDATRLLCASTVADMGIGMRICPRARDAPGRFQLVASGLSPRAMATQLTAVRAGRALSGSPHVDRLAAKARLELDEEEPYTLDGELFRARHIELSAEERIEFCRA